MLDHAVPLLRRGPGDHGALAVDATAAARLRALAGCPVSVVVALGGCSGSKAVALNHLAGREAFLQERHDACVWIVPSREAPALVLIEGPGGSDDDGGIGFAGFSLLAAVASTIFWCAERPSEASIDELAILLAPGTRARVSSSRGGHAGPASAPSLVWVSVGDEGAELEAALRTAPLGALLRSLMPSRSCERVPFHRRLLGPEMSPKRLGGGDIDGAMLLRALQAGCEFLNGQELGAPRGRLVTPMVWETERECSQAVAALRGCNGVGGVERSEATDASGHPPCNGDAGHGELPAAHTGATPHSLDSSTSVFAQPAANAAPAAATTVELSAPAGACCAATDATAHGAAGHACLRAPTDSPKTPTLYSQLLQSRHPLQTKPTSTCSQPASSPGAAASLPPPSSRRPASRPPFSCFASRPASRPSSQPASPSKLRATAQISSQLNSPLQRPIQNKPPSSRPLSLSIQTGRTASIDRSPQGSLGSPSGRSSNGRYAMAHPFHPHANQGFDSQSCLSREQGIFSV